MPLLPLRSLPVGDAAGRALTMRVDARPSGSCYVYVRREPDKKTWICKVRSLEEILTPTLPPPPPPPPLDLTAIVMCLYHGTSFDAAASHAYSGVPLELTRREVAFSQAENAGDGAYRLTMRVAIRSVSLAAPTAVPLMDASESPAEAIPVVDVSEETAVFGFNFTRSNVNLGHPTSPSAGMKRRTVCLRTVGPTFANAFLTWPDQLKDAGFLRVVNDGVRVFYDGIRSRSMNELEVAVHVVHPKAPALFVLSVNSRVVRAVQSTSYQAHPGGDVLHTISQFSVKVTDKSLLQVVLLPGSACALEGSSLTIRELDVTD